MLTEEINLDEEIAKQQEAEKDQPSTKLKAKSQLKFPTTSPFELSDSDLELPSELKGKPAGPKTPRTPKKQKAEASDSSDFDLAAVKEPQEGSSDFDLVPESNGNIQLEGEESDFSLEVDDGEQPVLEDSNTELTPSSSGLTLDNPADEGISLEQTDDDSSDFDLSLEPEDTPRPQKSQPAEDSSDFEMMSAKTPKPGKKKKPKAVEEVSDSSEFELSLDSDAQQPVLEGESDDSNFEINLESGEGEAVSEDSSEFELTLDDSGNLAAADDAPAPQVKSRKKGGAEEGEQDIFDTDFEVPAIDESDDATVADSELESSDFDLALDDSELAAEDESGSQVVALDEEDAETVADSDGDAAVVDDVDVEEESSDFADLDEDVQVEDVDEVEEAEGEAETKTKVKRETVIKEKLIEPAPWGIVPVVFMLPCVIIMVLVGLLGIEVIQSSTGMKPPGPLTVAIGESIGSPVTLKK
jgi:hypothetical protein